MRILHFTNMYPYDGAPFFGSFVDEEVQALRRAGVDVDVLFINGRKNKLNYLAMPRRFRRRMASADYDVVHVHHSFCALTATRQNAKPVVWTFHEGEILGGEEEVHRDKIHKRIAHSKAFKRSMAQRVDAVIVVADRMKEPLGRPDAVTLPMGVDTRLFRPVDTADARRQLGLDADTRYVLFPSSPSRLEKRYHLARDGVARYREVTGVTDVELVCLDNVPHDEVPLYMNASELMLMTSVFEASPVTVREALACDVPVLCTDVGDASVILGEIDGCDIVEPDPADIADKLAAALSRPRRVAGREKMQTYSLDATVEKLMGIYERVIREHGN